MAVELSFHCWTMRGQPRAQVPQGGGPRLREGGHTHAAKCILGNHAIRTNISPTLQFQMIVCGGGCVGGGGTLPVLDISGARCGLTALVVHYEWHRACVIHNVADQTYRVKTVIFCDSQKWNRRRFGGILVPSLFQTNDSTATRKARGAGIKTNAALL